MTETQDFQKYAYGTVAAGLAASKDSAKYASGALEVLAGPKGIALGEDAEGFIAGTNASADGIKTAIEVYDGKFQEYRNQVKLGELFGWYDSILSGLDTDQKAKILAQFDKFGRSTLGTITDKFKSAVYKTQDPAKHFSDDEKDKAEKLIEKYNPILRIVDKLDSYKIEEMRPDAVVATRDKELKDLTSRL